MTYPQFMDYVINYSLCSNEEIGNDDYLPQLPKNTFPPYIKYEHYAGNKRLTKKPKRKPRKRT